MPEGPEVKSTVDGLRHHLENREILSFVPMSGRYSRKDFSGFLDLIEELPLLITGVGCKGKFIYFLFADGSSLWNTLGMTGYWGQGAKKHSRMRLWIKQDGQEDRRGDVLFYNDQRNFGTFKYVTTAEELEKKLDSLGPDMLSEPPTFDEFKKCLLRGKRGSKTIAENLMNQSVVSGVGNYLKAEILYAAKVSPWRLCKDLSDDELNNLLNLSHTIMNTSYKSGGATIRNYRNPDGRGGRFNRRFAVFGWDKDPWDRVVIKEKTPDKRTTHWCPEVQV